LANKSITRIEGILQYYTTALGKNYNAYRNHVYRVYHLTLLVANKDLDRKEEEQLAIAAAFHDLGVWTHDTMNYLSPSIDLANAYMDENDIDNRQAIHLMINQHHQLKNYTGDHQKLVEAFRRADLIDLSLGKIRFQLPISFYQNLKEEFPFLGFHRLIYGKVIKYALTHFWKPFPMLR